MISYQPRQNVRSGKFAGIVANAEKGKFSTSARHNFKERPRLVKTLSVQEFTSTWSDLLLEKNRKRSVGDKPKRNEPTTSKHVVLAEVGDLYGSEGIPVIVKAALNSDGSKTSEPRGIEPKKRGTSGGAGSPSNASVPPRERGFSETRTHPQLVKSMSFHDKGLSGSNERLRKSGESTRPSRHPASYFGESSKGILKKSEEPTFQRPRGLSSVISCPICFEQYEEPKMLPCQHTFCLKCLKQYSSIDVDTVKCPTCRAVSQIPEEGLDKLPNNFSIQNMLDVIKASMKSEKTVSFPETCAICKEDRKASPCLHCGKTLCLECETVHFAELRSTAADLLKSLKAGKESVSCICDAIKSQVEKTEGNINVAYDTIIDNLKQQREQMIHTLGQIREETSQKTTFATTRIDGITSKLDAARMLDVIAEAEFLALKKSAELALNDVKKINFVRIGFDEAQFKLVIGEMPAAKQLQPMKSDDNLKKLQIPTTADEQSLFYRKKNPTAKMRFSHPLLQRPAGVAVSPWTGEIFVAGTDSHRVLIFDRQGNYQKSLGGTSSETDEETKFLCPFGIAFSLENEEVYVTDKWRNCIQVFDKSGNHRRQIGGKGGKGTASLRSPVGIAVDGKGLIYVCDTCNDRVLVLDKYGTQLKEIGERIQIGQNTAKSEFNEPTGVSVTPDGTRIAVCDYGNHRIKIFNKEGVRLENFGFRGTGRGQFEYPECLTIDGNGFILVGDNGNTRVQIFRPNGDFVCAFGSKKSDDFSWISGLTLTDENEVIVSDFKTHMISIF